MRAVTAADAGGRGRAMNSPIAVRAHGAVAAPRVCSVTSRGPGSDIPNDAHKAPPIPERISGLRLTAFNANTPPCQVLPCVATRSATSTPTVNTTAAFRAIATAVGGIAACPNRSTAIGNPTNAVLLYPADIATTFASDALRPSRRSVMKASV